MSTRPSLPLILTVVLIGVFLIVPTLIVIIMSFSSASTLGFPPPGLSLKWYANFFAEEKWIDGAWTSLKVAALTTVLATVLGTVAALGMVRGRYPLRSAVMAVIVSPMIVPIIIVAIGMYFVFMPWGMAGSVLGMVIAHTTLCLPFVVVNVVASLQNFDRNLEMAAQNLGAGQVRTFFRVTLPLIMPGVLAGALFAFVTSWDEVVVASFLASPYVRTLPVVMWDAVRTEVDPTIAALAAMLSVLTIVVGVSVMVVWRMGWKKR